MSLTSSGHSVVAAIDVTVKWTNEQNILKGRERGFKIMARQPPHSHPASFSEPAGMPSPSSRAWGASFPRGLEILQVRLGLQFRQEPVLVRVRKGLALGDGRENSFLGETDLTLHQQGRK